MIIKMSIAEVMKVTSIINVDMLGERPICVKYQDIFRKLRNKMECFGISVILERRTVEIEILEEEKIILIQYLEDKIKIYKAAKVPKETIEIFENVLNKVKG